jgi:uncharacterized protein
VLAIALSNGVRNVRVFGSVIQGHDHEGSDLDLLVDAPRGTTLLDMVRIQNAIEAQLGLHVDVLTAADLPVLFRDQVLQEARPLLARTSGISITLAISGTPSPRSSDTSLTKAKPSSWRVSFFRIESSGTSKSSARPSVN